MNLKEIVLPESLTSIEENAFSGCYDLVRVYYKGTPTTWSSINIGGGSGSHYITESTKLYYNENDLDDGNYYWHYDEDGNFKAWQRLAYEFEESTQTYTVTGIGSYTDTELVIPSTYKGYNVTSISNAAFAENKQITSVIVSDGIVSIGYNAFASCENLTNVVIANSVTNIKEYAFAACHKLINVNLGTGVKTIEQDVFYNCYELTSIYIPISVERLGNDLFDGCEKLVSVNYEGTEEQWRNVISHSVFVYSGTVNYNQTA